MPRNLDLTALRAFATVASVGSVTRAAALLNLTQSAVSMQLKRLETALDTQLLNRTPRGVLPTADGEVVLALANRMLSLNDELLDRMRASEGVAEITLGVPHDLVPRAIPQVLRAFAADYPRTRVNLISSVTNDLRDRFADGTLDLMLGTEAAAAPGGEELVRLPLIWVGAEGGEAWRQRPLRLAFEERCIFRSQTQAALDAAGIPWDLAIVARSSRAADAAVSADLACHVLIDGFDTGEMRPILHGGALPEIGDVAITFYAAPSPSDAARDRLIEVIRATYGGLRSIRRPSLSIAATG
ncbi:MAG: LysR family transcriptional regulator [Pseudomonadota bacterium]